MPISEKDSSTIALGSSLDLAIVFEGVETEEQVQFLATTIISISIRIPSNFKPVSRIICELTVFVFFIFFIPTSGNNNQSVQTVRLFHGRHDLMWRR